MSILDKWRSNEKLYLTFFPTNEIPLPKLIYQQDKIKGEYAFFSYCPYPNTAGPFRPLLNLT